MSLGQVKNWGLLGAVGAGQLAVRLYMLGSSPWFAAADNPVARESSFIARTLTFLYLPAFNAGLLLWPARLSFDWSMDAVPPVKRLDDPRNVASLLFYATLFLLAKRAAQSRRVAMALALLVTPFIPASNLLFYVGFVVAERVLYLPSMGFCLLLAVGLDRVLTGGSKWRHHRLVRSTAVLAAVATLCLWSARSVRRNGDWTSEESLYRSAIAINPAKGKQGNSRMLAVPNFVASGAERARSNCDKSCAKRQSSMGESRASTHGNSRLCVPCFPVPMLQRTPVHQSGRGSAMRRASRILHPGEMRAAQQMYGARTRACHAPDELPASAGAANSLQTARKRSRAVTELLTSIASVERSSRLLSEMRDDCAHSKWRSSGRRSRGRPHRARQRQWRSITRPSGDGRLGARVETSIPRFPPAPGNFN